MTVVDFTRPPSNARRLRAALAALLAALLALSLVACVGGTAPDSSLCEPEAVEIELALTATSLAPRDPAACRDQIVTLLVDAAADGVFHIHGYDAEVPATSLVAGEVTEISFEAGRSGQFPIEFHAADDPQGVGIGILTIHEP